MFNTAEIALIRSEPRSAEPKPFTFKCELHLEVNSNIAAFITKVNRPSESKRAGKVKNLRKVPKIAFINPTSIPAGQSIMTK